MTEEPMTEATYSEADITEQASTFELSAADVAGIFRSEGVEQMTENEFRTAKTRWQTEGAA